jgi:DNA ligase-1
MKLANREVTGDAAERLLQDTVALFEYESQEILYKIIERNLKIGISLDNFLDVIGEKESKFEVALAENLNKVKGVNPIDGTYFISRKLDGVRCICYLTKTWEGGDLVYRVNFKSRQGKDILTLGNLINPIMEATGELPEGDWVLDGEICIMDENGNENFHGLMKEVTRKNHTIENPRYNVFDILTLDEFEGKVTSRPFSERNAMLCRLQDPNYTEVSVLDQERVTSQEVLDRWVATAKENGWEGCMLRKDVPYKRGRSKDLLKIKGMQDAEYEVVGVETGKATYNEGGHKEFDVASALYIKHKDNIVKVGSGLSKEQRLRWFDHPEEIIGKMITVQYFEETQDSKTGEYSLRFPVLKHVYEDGRDC